MDTLGHLLKLCQDYPDIGFDTITTYINFLRHLKEHIDFTQCVNYSNPPQCLPTTIHNLLKQALELDDTTTQVCWSALKELAWSQDPNMPSTPDLVALLPIFLRHGGPLGIALIELFPPTCVCLLTTCPNYSQSADDAPYLAEPSSHKATVFTLVHGSLPMRTFSTYCQGCLTSYHHDFYVSQGIHTYYNIDTPMIQVSTRFFINGILCEHFILQMNLAWTSASNCANIYNEAVQLHPWFHILPQNWPAKFTLDYELVAEAFIIYSLRERHRTHDENGDIIAVYHAVVTDGISLGHPCCGVHDCKEPLASNADRYCQVHGDLSNKCAVVKCHADPNEGYRTCSILSHRAAKEHYKARGKAMFQLKHRLAKNFNCEAKNATSSSGNGVADEEGIVTERDREDDEYEDDDEVGLDENGDEVDETTGQSEAASTSNEANVSETLDCQNKPPDGHRKVFSRFGRRRTHNEQLCVACCGMILGRAMFYGAEGPRSVMQFWKLLFPTKASLPSTIFFNTNCAIAAMNEASGDTYFENVALPVDVFHFKSKHKESDDFCGCYCNLARWIELMDKKTGKWLFNSSAAEQVNSWFGCYRAMTWIMHADR
ncbi:hypothetical protein K439DRAFT_1614479 [Ramaria rubella]|nr:hypothetical protein K439DRAFT_1614479 [Ramaria rubella]